MKKAIVTVCNDGYVRLTKVMLYSFLKNNKYYDGDIIVVHDEGAECNLSEESKGKLLKICPNIIFHCVNSEEYKGAFEHFNGRLEKNFNSAFYKFEIFDFLYKYDIVVLIDGDMLILNNIDSIFHIKAPISMCEDRGLKEINGEFISILPNNNHFWIESKSKYCNSGLIVINTEYFHAKNAKKDLLELSENFDFSINEPFSPLKDKFPEQDVLNTYYHDAIYVLSNTYNMPKRNFFNGHNMEIIKDTKILHYLADKPFMETEENTYYGEINKLWLKEEEEMNNSLKKNDECKIVGITLTYNEADKVPYVMPYYERIGIDKLVVYDNGSTDNTIELLKQYPFVEVRHYETDGEMNNDVFIEMKNNKWKEFKGKYDWAIMCDFDEVIFCRNGNLKEKLKATEGTIFQKTMLDIYCDSFPNTSSYAHMVCDGLSPWIYGIDFFLPYVMGNKHLLFRLNDIDEMNYGYGGHSSNPYGNVGYFTDDDIFVFHLKYLDIQYIVNKSEENYYRQISKGEKGSSRPEYLRNIKNLKYTYELMKKNKISSLDEYNKSLINGLFYPIKLLIFTKINSAEEVKQCAYSIREKLYNQPDICLEWIIMKGNKDLDTDVVFDAVGDIKWSTFIFPQDSNAVQQTMEKHKGEDYWVLFLNSNNIIHSNLRFLLRKALQTEKEKKVICLNYEDKDNAIYKKCTDLFKGQNLVIHSSLYGKDNFRITMDNIAYEDDICGDNNKVSAFSNMVRSQQDFDWDHGRLDNGEVTLKIESEWERIPLVYSIPNDVKHQIFEIIEESYKRNGLL